MKKHRQLEQYVFTASFNTIYWQSARITSLCTSSFAAETMAASASLNHAIHLNNLLNQVFFWYKMATRNATMRFTD